MQIRVANKQDEADIRAFFQECYRKHFSDSDRVSRSDSGEETESASAETSSPLSGAKTCSTSRPDETCSAELELDGRDKDLKNIEGYYFGNNGLFLVAEEDGAIVGAVGARALSESVLGLLRLETPEVPFAEIAGEFLERVTAFAPRMLYRSIEVQIVPSKLEGSEEYASLSTLLSNHGFKQCSNALSWHKAVHPDF